MIALFDSGSSRLHSGFWDNGRVMGVEHSHYPEHAGDLAPLIAGILAGSDAKESVACSVSGFWREPLFRTIAALVPHGLRVVRTAADIGIRVSYAQPETYGVDRALAVFAAYHRYHGSCVVVDAGTALTVDAVSFDCSVLGGFILPGFAAQSIALAASTNLPVVNAAPPDDELGASTNDAIRLGIGYGLRAAVADLVSRARRQSNAEDRVILTGSDARLIAPAFERTIDLVDHLVLEGLALAAPGLKPFS
jgi:type III pantothenate kinase